VSTTIAALHILCHAPSMPQDVAVNDRSLNPALPASRRLAIRGALRRFAWSRRRDFVMAAFICNAMPPHCFAHCRVHH
jgi:hypothetical protein